MRLITVFCALLILQGIAISATLNVPFDYPSIQQAIDAADHGDTVLVNRGTYYENINFKGKAITVISADGPHATVIDGNQKGSVVTFCTWEGENSVLEGFTITNGSGSAIQYYEEVYICGGGVCCRAFTSPVLKNNVIRKNKAEDWGGGIFCHFKASPRILNNTVCQNESSSGGAIYCLVESAPVILENSLFENTAQNGGAIFCDESCYATIRKNYVGENSAGEGYDAIEGTTSSTTILENTLE